MTALTAQTDAACDRALAALGRLRASWPLLSEMRQHSPGYGPVRRPVSTAQAAARAVEHRLDRDALMEASRTKSKIFGARRDIARIAIISARVQVYGNVTTLTNRISRDLYGCPPPWPTGPAAWRMSLPCSWCDGTGRAVQPATWRWDWPDPAPVCPRCSGRRVCCTVCGTAGPCGCGSLDARVIVAIDLLSPALEAARRGIAVEIASLAARVLEGADRLARDACGLGEDRRVIAAPCPACDRLELAAEVSSPNRAEWAIECLSPLCVCTGTGCGCGRPTRIEGVRHLWIARLWDGPHGLARRLGVDLPGTRVPEASA